MSELGHECGLSQVELADRLDIQQAAVSRLEGRSDMLVSTLESVVEAMGGTLKISARFPDGSERELQFGREANGNSCETFLQFR